MAMKSTGVVRQLDSLGRIVLPIELRRTMDIGVKDMVEIFVEEGSEAVGKVYDPGKSVAVPGNTSRQRIAQSGRVYSS